MDLLTFFGMVLPWVLVCLALWLGIQFLGQMGRILLRLDALEQQLRQLALTPTQPSAPAAPAVTGLDVGTEAPAFDVPKLSGGRGKLSQYRGRKVLLMFFNPQCGFCTQMLPALAALPVDDKGAPLPLVITTGKADENRRLFEEHKVRCPILLQEQMTLASKYQVNGTPMGYLIDEQGKIASSLTVGADALVALASASSSLSADNNQGLGKANRGLEASRINRDGLKAGTPAPDFKLPDVDGRELALRDFRKQRVVLVFSDPQCGPCDELAPQLEKIHRQRSDIRVLMVSRRDVDENRVKAKKFGLTFPLVLQRQWEISTLYGMFATPIGYLIDEAGVIAADVAVGVEQILALVGGPDTTDAGDASKRNGDSRHAPIAARSH
jgi:methylamine dehydrogenase accessory protein MauD